VLQITEEEKPSILPKLAVIQGVIPFTIRQIGIPST
jgi:hypothetical protein